MDKKRFEQAMVKYSEDTGIGLHQLRGYLTDGRLIGILKIYDEDPYYISNPQEKPDGVKSDKSRSNVRATEMETSIRRDNFVDNISQKPYSEERSKGNTPIKSTVDNHQETESAEFRVLTSSNSVKLQTDSRPGVVHKNPGAEGR
jgi:hypothetical protein